MAVDIAGQIKARADRNTANGATMGMISPPRPEPTQPPATTNPTDPGPDDPFNRSMLPWEDPNKPNPGDPKTPTEEFNWQNWIDEFMQDGDGGGGPGFEPFTWDGPQPEAFSFSNLSLPTWQTPGEFVAPTEADLLKDPGYQSRIHAGEKAIQRSAAAKGTLLTGGTLQDLNTFAQDYASNELDKLYGRKFQEHESLWNHSLQKYQADVDAAYRSWSSNFENAKMSWSSNRENLMWAYDNARQAWADKQNAQQAAASAADAARRRREDFLRSLL